MESLFRLWNERFGQPSTLTEYKISESYAYPYGNRSIDLRGLPPFMNKYNVRGKDDNFLFKSNGCQIVRKDGSDKGQLHVLPFPFVEMNGGATVSSVMFFYAMCNYWDANDKGLLGKQDCFTTIGGKTNGNFARLARNKLGGRVFYLTADLGMQEMTAEEIINSHEELGVWFDLSVLKNNVESLMQTKAFGKSVELSIRWFETQGLT